MAEVAKPLFGKRICILRTWPITHDKRTRQVAGILAEAGADVTVVSISASESEVPQGAGYAVRRVWPGPPSAHRMRIVRIAQNLARMWRQHRLAIDAVRELEPDAVHCMNLDTLLQGHRGAAGAPVVYDSREHWATTGDLPGHIRMWRRAKERYLIRRAAHVMTVSDMIAADLAERYGIETPTVIYNGCTEYVREAQPPHDPLRVLHTGKFYMDRHLEELVSAAARFVGRVHVTLLGWGEAEDALRAQIAELGLEDTVAIEPPRPPEEVIGFTAQFDVGVINIRPDSLSHRLTGSNKLFDYMGAGLAELVSDLDFTRMIVERAGCGVVFEQGVDGMAEKLAFLVENPDEVAKMKRSAVAAAPEYSWDRQAPRLVAAYTALLR